MHETSCTGQGGGYRTLRVDSSNFLETAKAPQLSNQLLLGELVNTIKPGRDSDDLLFQVLISWGAELSVPIEVTNIEGREVYLVDDGALIACFDEKIDAGLVRAMAQRRPLRAVFRDWAFTDDSARINAEQIFRELSPQTSLKVL